MHHTTNVQFQQVWKERMLSLWNFDTMQAGDVCWCTKCFERIFACLSVGNCETNHQISINLWQQPWYGFVRSSKGDVWCDNFEEL